MTKKYSIKDLAYLVTMGVIGLLIVLLGLTFIFFSDVKGLQNDATRVKDFEQIKSQIQYYISSKSEFPESLKAVESMYGVRSYYYDSSSNSNKSIYVDPKTNNYYELKYNNDKESYRICTEFEVGSSDTRLKNSAFNFSKGYSCIDYELELYYQNILKGKSNSGVTPGYK